MQTKSSYRVMNWTVLAALATTLATACVVSSGDGNGDGTDLEEGGSSGSSTTKGGSAGTGGSKGGSGGSTTTAGTGGTDTTGNAGASPTAGAGTGGGGGEEYVAGLCQADSPTPSMVPSCDLKPGEEESEDPDVVCLVCLKTKCCTDLKNCYGTEPTTACGYGPTAADDLGQFDCIRTCVVENGADADDNTANFEMCADGCLKQCEEPDAGLIMDDTNSILGCANDSCIAECFPVQ